MKVLAPSAKLMASVAPKPDDIAGDRAAADVEHVAVAGEQDCAR